MKRFGAFTGEAGENLQYGDGTATDIVMQLFVDDGVSDRGHRIGMMSKSYKKTAVQTCSHS
jgi:uncharacterized protein YkwD